MPEIEVFEQLSAQAQPLTRLLGREVNGQHLTRPQIASEKFNCNRLLGSCGRLLSELCTMPLCRRFVNCVRTAHHEARPLPPLSLSPRTIIPLAGERERRARERANEAVMWQPRSSLALPLSQERSSSRCSRPLRWLPPSPPSFARSFLPPPSRSLVFPNRPSTIKFQALCRRFEARSVGQASQTPLSLARSPCRPCHARSQGGS